MNKNESKPLDILLGTSNLGKLKEYEEMFVGYNVKFHTLKEFNIDIDIDENGKTYKENALIKANALKSFTSMPLLTDDSGIEIDALGEHFPGIYTHRYAIKNGGFAKNNAFLSSTYPGSKAKFSCCICIVFPSQDPLFFEGEVKGKIANNTYGVEGFGYDPIFIPDGYKETFAQLGEEIKNSISHRGNAVKYLIEYLKENNLI
jgi:XTP/dITP diphosphohydrolase